MPETHTLRLGPLSFRTTADSGPTEALGNAIEIVGAALTSADPAPKPFSLSVPVGFSGREPREDGMLLRRQVRALLNNAPARMQGLYFSWTVDPELDAWLIVGGGDLEPAPGVASGEWRLTLRDCYVAGRRRTHREAVVMTRARDRRISTVARDTLERAYRSDDFWQSFGRTQVALPAGASDVVTPASAPLVQQRQSAVGPLTVVTGLHAGEVAQFERAVADDTSCDVRLRDRRGATDESEWIDVLGPDQPLTPDDVPVLENALCRVVWAVGRLRLYGWNTVWTERGRVPLGTLVSVNVRSWSPDQAELAITVLDGDGTRAVVCVTLARGWQGPQIEVYAPQARLRYVASTSGPVTFRQPSLQTDIVATGSPLIAAETTFGGANWVELRHGPTSDVLAVSAILRTLRGSESASFGSSRSYVELASERWAGARIALGIPSSGTIVDGFDSDTLSSYTVTGSGLSVSGGAVRVATTADKALIHNASEGFDRVVLMKVNTGASTTTWILRLLARATATSSYVAGELTQAGQLRILKRVEGVETTLASVTVGNLAPNVSRWLLLRTDGGRIDLHLWTSAPVPGAGLPSFTVQGELSEDELAAFPQGRGRSGAVLRPGGVDWSYDDLQMSTSGGAAELGQSLILDGRSTPALIPRT